MKRDAVDVRRAKIIEAEDMLIGAIAFVPCQAVTGVNGIQLYHDMVACDLGDDRSAGDGKAQAVSINDALLRKRYLRKKEIVYQQRFRLGRKLLDGLPHGDARGDYDVISVDKLMGDNAGPAGDGCFGYVREEEFSFFRR